ncbi:hypothetical protein HD554DRAFT_2177923 [Boletus coccyginus]|nr:hypothetical protein HD554DRAFT_2177923 [Boletus coccyginus]
MALGHLKSQHDFVVQATQKSAFEQLCKDYLIYKKPQDVILPKAGGPPVQGIAAPVEGFACCAGNACEYSVCDVQMMIRHSKEKHARRITGERTHRPCLVQCIFRGVGKVYFEVDPTATFECDLDVRRYLRATFLPAHAMDPIVPQDLDRDRPQLLIVTLWDEFHPEIRKDDIQRNAAWRLKAAHTAEERGGVFVSLERAVKQHHIGVRVLLNECLHSFTIKKILLNSRDYTPQQTDYFRFVSKENVAYDSLFLQMVRSMVRVELGHEFKMRFEYTSAQREALQNLIKFLEKDARETTESTQVDALQAYHRFCWTLVNTRDAQCQKKWQNPMERFLWLRALCSDGSFLPAKLLTSILAQLKYFCRLIALHEGLSNRERMPVQLDDLTSVLLCPRACVEANERVPSCRRIADIYEMVLRLGRQTPFNMLFELQQFMSSQAYGQEADPQVYVDPSYQWISIGKQTLHLQSLRDGMQTLIRTVKDLYVTLSGEDVWVGLPAGLKVIDDLSNLGRGYSFLEELPFRVEKHSFFLSLVQRQRLGTVMADGMWSWDHVAVREFLDSADRLWGYAIHALYVGVHLSTRVTQFLQHQIRNADRPRNLFFTGEEGFFFTRYSKTTHLKGRDSCVPAVLSEPLRELLLVLLGSGFREAQAILAGIEHGEEAQSLYQTYLCVANGKRVTPDEFCRDLPKRNHEIFGCLWGARDFRQGMITLAHEFISPNQSFACADDLLAEAADHSAEVDVAHYGVVHGALPRVTNNDMNNHRWLAEEWGSLLGLGPFPPPEPVQAVRRKTRSTKEAEVNQLAAQVAAQVADVMMKRLADLGNSFVDIQMEDTFPTTPRPFDTLPGSADEDAVPFVQLSGQRRNTIPRSSQVQKQPSLGALEAQPLSPSGNHSLCIRSSTQRRKVIAEISYLPESPRPLKHSRACSAEKVQAYFQEDSLEEEHLSSAEDLILYNTSSATNLGTQCSAASTVYKDEPVSLVNMRSPVAEGDEDLEENI